MKRGLLILFAALLVGCGSEEDAVQAPAANSMTEGQMLDRGRQLTEIAGCNDCHTDGYAQAAGQMPEAQRLMGSVIGWKGPWGTTYPINLRLFMQTLDEEQWVAFALTRQSRPPMPWFAFQDMEEQDLRAIYRYIRSLGPAGEMAPAYLPPGEEPPVPHFALVLPAQPTGEAQP